MKVNLNDGTSHEIDPNKDVIKAVNPKIVPKYANFDSTIKHLTKENFSHAEFCNRDRTHVRVWYHNPDRKDLKPGEHDHFIVDLEDQTADGGPHPYIKRLFEITTLDAIHETTYKRNKQYERMFKEFAIQCAKDQGLVIDPIAYYDSDTGTSKIDTKFFGQTLKLLFNDFNENESKEDLFVVKLAAFELDLVKNSNNREIKSRLRKAKTPIEVLETLMELKTISEIPV